MINLPLVLASAAGGYIVGELLTPAPFSRPVYGAESRSEVVAVARHLWLNGIDGTIASLESENGSVHVLLVRPADWERGLVLAQEAFI
jgi:hypothetical protein